MTLLVTIFAACTVTLIWYLNSTARELKIDVLCWLFWGASIMWLVDAVAEYLEVGTEIFNPAAEALLNDLFLGLCVLALAFVIWIVVVLIKDPKGTVKAALRRS